MPTLLAALIEYKQSVSSLFLFVCNEKCQNGVFCAISFIEYKTVLRDCMIMRLVFFRPFEHGWHFGFFVRYDDKQAMNAALAVRSCLLLFVVAMSMRVCLQIHQLL